MTTERSVSRRGFLRAAVGAGGVIGATGTSAAAEQTDTGTGIGTGGGTPTGTGGGGTATGTGTGGGGETHTVDMTDDLVFDPDEITIAPGDTIEWVNVGSVGHTVTAYQDGIPNGSTYFASGGFESEEAARGDMQAGLIPGGGSYSHTFETTGTFEYFCIPHESSMKGTVIVEEGAGQGTATPSVIPDSAKTLGVATFGGLVGAVGLAYVFLKYGGGQPDASE